MKGFKLIKVCSLMVITLYSVSLVANGNLDRSFSSCGRVETSFGIDSTAKAIAVQPDGKMIVAGYSDMNGQNTFALVRYNTDGTVDKSFGYDGIALTKFGANEKASGAQAVMIQPDGKIVAAGFTNAIKNTFRWCLARYNEDGSPDITFFGGRGIMPGTVINTFGGIDDASQVHALAMQPDGKIVAAGISAMADKVVFALARYNHDGSLDATFNKDSHGSIPGIIRTDFGSLHKKDDRAYAVMVQPDGKIVAGGSSYVSGCKTFALARYLPDGSLDASFYNPGFSKVHGTVIASFAGGETNAAIKALLMQADGTIVAGGYTNSCHMPSDNLRFALARFLPCGQLDASFGAGGMGIIPGTVVTSFGPQEGSSQINSMVMQSDGKIIAGGFTKTKNDSCFALARYHENGSLDFVFNNADSVAGTVRTKFPGSMEDEIYCLALHPSGSLVAVGKTATNIRPHMALARYVCMDHEMMAPSFDYPQRGQKIVNGSAIKLTGKSQKPGVVSVYLNDRLVDSVYTKNNDWSMTLPPLASGEYSLYACQNYPGGNVNLMSDMSTFIVDQHPRAINQQFVTAQDNPLMAKLNVSGASGKYNYKVLNSDNGKVTFENDMFTFMPMVDEGMGSFEFEAIDCETACSSKAKVLITIFPLPIVQNVDYTVCQDISFEGNLADHVTKGLRPYSFSLINSDDSGMLKLNEDGSFVFAPTHEFRGKARFGYQVTDSRSNKSKPGVITIEVLGSPIAHNAFFTICQDTQLVGTLTTLVTGGKPQYVYHLVVDSAQNGVAELQDNGTFNFVPTAEFNGQASFKYTVTDANECTSKEGTIVVKVLEKPASGNGTFTTVENTQLTASLADLISKGTAPYTFNVIEKPSNGSLTINADGSFDYVPGNDFSGVVTFVYNIVDANKCVSNNAEITIVVNPKPKVDSVSAATCQDTQVTGSLASAITAGSAPFTYVLVNGSQAAQLQLNNDGSYVFTPMQESNGQIAFEYQVIDALGIASNIATLAIEVYQRPEVKDDAKTICQDATLNDSLANLASAGLAPYQFSLVSESADGTVNINADGQYTFVPTQGFSGVTSFKYVVVDAHNCISKEATVTITVLEKIIITNQVITLAQDGILEGNLNNYITSGSLPYIFNKISEINGNLQLNEDGSYTFVATPGFVGIAGFEFEVTNAYNCASQGQVSVIVQPKPVVVDYNKYICQGTSLSGSLLESVVNGTPPYVFSQIGDAFNATVQLNEDGSFVITPFSEIDTQASFQYLVTDANGYVSEVATVTTLMYQAPQIQEYTLQVNINNLLNGNLTQVVSGGTPEYHFSQIGIAQNGNVVIDAAGSFVFIPHANFVGEAQFNYQVIDAKGCKSNGTVTIQVVEPVQEVVVENNQEQSLETQEVKRKTRRVRSYKNK